MIACVREKPRFPATDKLQRLRRRDGLHHRLRVRKANVLGSRGRSAAAQ
jgi:hypothetical protein